MRADNKGFTLLEMVVALTILAAMAGFLTVAFRMASASISRGEDAAREMARLRGAIAILEHAVRSADATAFPAGDRMSPYFRGEPNRLRFLSTCAPAALSGGGPRLLSVFEAERGGLSLAHASPFRAGGADAWEGTEGARPILPGARNLSFAYSAGPDEEGAWEWVERWDAAEVGRLPAAIRLELTTAAETGTPLETAYVVPILGGG